MRIDLHAHSTASDGTDTPTELMGAAVAAGLTVIAITDHDTTSGWREALRARAPQLTVIVGTEFSCVHRAADGRRISLHLLAYLFDPDDPGMRAEQTRLQLSRQTRGEQIVARLAADGYPITWKQVIDLAAGGTVGRPHISRALVRAGVVPTVSAAFTQLLSSRGPYYVAKADTPVLEAIALIKTAGGLPVFAHPLARRRGPVVDDDVIAAMTTAGLVGLEVDHPDHDAEDRAHAAALARDLGLIGTGSSDYHGTNKTVELGQCVTSPEAFEQLLALPTARRPASG